MNKIYKLIWSQTANAFVVVSELASARGKSSSTTNNAALGAWVAVSEITKSKGKKSNKAIKSGVLVSSLVLFAGNAIAAPYDAGGGSATGLDSVAIGSGAASQGIRSVAMGADSEAIGISSTAIGPGAKTAADDALAIGRSAQAIGRYSTAVGDQAKANQEFSNAFGYRATANAVRSTAIGMNSSTSGDDSVSIGNSSSVSGNWSAALGQEASVQGDWSTAIGFKANAKSTGSTAIGTWAKTSGVDAAAFGNAAEASGSKSLALGRSAKTGSMADQALAVGVNASAAGITSNAIGWKANATAQDATAIGSSAKAYSRNGIAMGTNATVSGGDSVGIGVDSKTGTGSGMVAIGDGASTDNKSNLNTSTTKTQSNRQSVAIGSRAQAWGDQSVSIGNDTKASGNSSVAIGGDDIDKVRNQYQGLYRSITGKNMPSGYVSTESSGAGATAIGVMTTASGHFASALGMTAEASGDGSVAIGPTAKSSGEAGVAIGIESQAKADNAIAIGTGAQATGKQSISVGKGNVVSRDKSGAFGDSTTISGTGSYSTGNNNTIATNDTFVVGSNVTKTLDNSVFLGKNAAYTAKGASTDGIGAVTEPVTVGGKLTYGGFAGKTPVGVVSVGDVGKERRIQNVAAGKIAATSTDAINGSQLYATNAKLGNVAKTVVENFGGNATLNPDGSITYTNIGNTGKDNIHDAIQAATTKVEEADGIKVVPTTNADGSTTYTVSAKTDGTTTKIDGNGNIAAVTAPLTNTDGKVNTPAAPNALATAGDIANAINNSGWKLAADGTTGTELINPSDTVTFKTGSSNLTVKRDGANITYDLAKDIAVDSVKTGDTTVNTYGVSIANADPNKVVSLTASGLNNGNNRITNVAAGQAGTDAVNVSQLKAAQAAATTKVEEADGIKVVPTTNADGSTTYTVSAKTDGTTTKIDGNGNIAAVTTTFTPSTDGKVGAPVGNGDSLVTANTVANAINNSGWKATSGATGSGVVNGTTEELINPSETVTFQAGDNMVLNQAGNVFTYSLNKDININSVQIGANGPKITNDGNNIKIGDKDGNATKITNVAAGTGDTDAVNVSQLKAAQAAATTKVEEADGIKVVPTTNADGSTTYTVSAKTDGTTTKIDGNGNIAAVTTTFTPSTDGKVGAPVGNGDSLVTAKTVADAINNSGWKLAADGTTGTELINPSDTVTFKTGSSNLTVKRDGANITYDLAKDININSVQFNDGPKITNDGDNIKVGDKDGKATKITNVKAGEANTDAVNVSQLKAAQAAATTKVEEADGIKVVPTTNADGSTTYTVSAKTDGTTTKIDGNGNIAAVTTTFTPSTDGKVGAPVGNGDSLVTANTVANAINNSGWKATSGATGSGVVNGTTEELINPSETVTFQAGDNMVLNQAGNVFTYSLNKDININSVQIGANGPKITNDGNNIKIGDKDGNATKITNVAAGTGDTDAVNVSQLKAAQAAATTKVEEADGIKVVPTTNADGSTTYTVSAKTDGTTTKIDGNGNIAAVTAPLTNTDGKVNTPAAPNALATAGDIANAINNSGWKLAADGTTGTELINPSDTVTFKTGSSNLTVKRDGANITYDLAKDIAVDSVKTGDTTVNTYGVSIANADPNKVVSLTASGLNNGNNRITNVAAGQAGTDAVNVSQLKAAQAAATTKVEEADGIKVVPTTNADGSTTYTVSAKTDGTTTKIDGNGNIAAVTTTFTPSTDGKVGAPVGNGDSLVTANTVANAINNSGWKATSGATGSGVVNGTTEELINPSETVTFQAGDNMVLNQAGNVFTYSLNKDININSVQIGANGPKITNDGNNIKIGDKDGNATKITNVAAGTGDTDAVNVSQLKAAQAAATTKVEGDKGVSVTPKTNTDGSTTYTVAAKTDGTTTKIDGNGNIAAVTTTFTPSTDGKVGAPVGNGDSLVTANTVANAINNSGWKATSGATGSGVVNGTTEELINPSETVTFQAGDNMVLNQAGNVFTYSLNKDININSVQIGANGPKITNDGNNIKIGDKDGNATKITNVAAGTGDTDAVNVSQLKAVEATANKGWNLTTNGKADSKSNVKPGDTVDFANTDGNVKIENTGNKVTVNLNKDIDLTKDGSVTIGDTKVNNDGLTIVGGPSVTKSGIDAGDKKITNVADGVISATSKDAVNGSQLYQAVNNINTSIAASKEEVKSADGSVTVTTTQNAKGANVYDLSVNTDGTTIKKNADGSLAVNTTPLTNNADGTVKTPTAPNAIATAGDIANAINNSGFTLTAKGSNGSLVKPGATVDMNNTDGNIVISKSASDNNVTYNLAKNVKVDSVTAGDTVMGTDGITINNGSANGNTVSLTKDGLNNGGNRITNVAPGVDATDAVNVSQLQGLAHHINNRIDDVADDANAGVSSAMAMAALPQAYIPGKSMLTGGIASYNGEGAVAVGFSKLSDNGRWVLKVSGSADTQGNAGGAVGAGFHF